MPQSVFVPVHGCTLSVGDIVTIRPDHQLRRILKEKRFVITCIYPFSKGKFVFRAVSSSEGRIPYYFSDSEIVPVNTPNVSVSFHGRPFVLSRSPLYRSNATVLTIP